MTPTLATPKRYHCKRCGFTKTQTTNHTENTRSWEHRSTCPNCPPWAKYPEYGGQTIWEYEGPAKTESEATP